ncbi:MAG: CheR family methyltransferase [Gammaproteobacteria bacterium]
MTRLFAFTPKDFDRLRGLVRRHTGISLCALKQDMVYRRLSPRLKELGLTCFAEYCQHLAQGNSDEVEQFTNAITTNLTSFFREPHHFEYLANTVLPELIAQKASLRRLRFWSAGCSSGEEAYSLAMVVKESLPDLAEWDVRILATDIDSNMLTKAKSGIYSQERVQELSEERLKRFFLKGRGGHRGMVRVVRHLRSLVQFKRLNLVHTWPMRGPFDIIFCRNVVIYFDKETKCATFNRFAELMGNGNHLFVGHSENLFRLSDRFHLVNKTIYRKVAG